MRGAGVAIVGQASNFVVSLGSVVVLARLLTPADFGIMTMVTTFGLLFRSFGLSGFTEVILQREELTHTLTSSLFWVELCIGGLLTVAFVALSPLIALFYHNAAVTRAAQGVSLTICIGSLGWIHMALLQRAMHFKATAMINFAGQLVLVIVSILLALFGWHYWALVWGSVSQSIVVTAGACLMCRWRPSWPSRLSRIGSDLKFAFSVYSHFAFSYLTRNTDNLLVGWRYGARSLGFYKRAYDLFVLPETQLLAPMSAVVVSTLSRINRDREQFIRYFLRTISVLAFVGMGIGTDFALIGKDLIRLLLGPGWEEAGLIFALFGPGIGVMLLYDTHGWIHLSIGRPERWFIWGLIEFACTGSLFLLTLHWGPSGIALAWTASFFLLMFPGFWYAGKPIRLGMGAILSAIWRYFLASVIAGCATAAIGRALPAFTGVNGAMAAFLKLISVSVIFFVLYLGAIIALHKGLEPVQQMLDLLRDILPNRSNTVSAPQDTEGQPAA